MKIDHQMVIANAGSGKTYNLTTRIITLLSLGVNPERIAALTFTKKAAGEFLDLLFQRLAQAALDPQKLQELHIATGVPSLSTSGVHQILSRLIAQLGTLCMGTIDSLFVRMARAFPLELGLAQDFTLLGDLEIAIAQEDALLTLFQNSGSNPREFQIFLDLIRQQNRRQGERSSFSALLQSVTSLQSRYLDTPPHASWGNPQSIWPKGCSLLHAADPKSAAKALQAAIEHTHPELPCEAQQSWATGLALIQKLPSGTVWENKELKKFIETRLLTESEDKKTGEKYIPTGRTKAARVVLYPQVQEARDSLAHALLRREIEFLLQRSKALYHLMSHFEKIYALRTRNQGRLTFDDIARLLARQAASPEWQTLVGYRLDACYDHWLLDEFQDTSRIQWQVLSTFIDEVVQDAEGRRSFFYVGDVKQALYLWRGGDPELFFEIRNHYNGKEKEGPILAQTLSDSYRSCPQILNTINTVFGKLEALAAPLSLPSACIERWKEGWREHRAAPHNPQEGYVRWSAVPAESQQEVSNHCAEDIALLHTLKEILPWNRGWSCAVLKRNNQQAAALASLLQAWGIPVALEGRCAPCTDNPLAVALLAAFRFVGSPQNSWARFVLQSSALGPLMGPDGGLLFREETLRSVASSGFAPTARKWITRIDTADEPFLQERVSTFLSAAAHFDATHSGSIQEFLTFIENYQISEVESPDRVRVMTIHQAKGLTFDMTLVSGLNAFSQDRTAGQLFLGSRTDTTHSPRWGLLLPKRDIAQRDKTLAHAREEELAHSTYGELCTAYVAMTRARYALYLFTPQLPEHSTAKSFARMLELTLGQGDPYYETGTGDWYERKPLITPPYSAADVSLPQENTPHTPAFTLPPPLHGTQHALSPSPASPCSLFLQKGISSRILDRELHEALAHIEWLVEPAKETGPLRNPSLSLPKCSPQAKEILQAFFAHPKHRAIFTPPGCPCRLWREQPFEVMQEGTWISGRFDRVHLFLDASGGYISATLYAFKLSPQRAEQVATPPASQRELYRKALAALIGLPLTAIEAEIVAIALE